jgi:large subunit ribosomal protein L21e
MVKRTRGIRQASRNKLRKDARDKGMPPINRVLKTFKVGDLVSIRLEPAIHKGMPHHRYQGKIGKVTGTRGSSYLLELKDGDKKKLIISRPVHLVKVVQK